MFGDTEDSQQKTSAKKFGETTSEKSSK
jgi:hypothetical protein